MSTKKTIAKSFTVSTIEDGVSVQAQYAPNANPTSGQIHTVWQDGDLYMRTRESDDATWSSWHKIVGESGGETDFSFGISQYKTTANASTAPSDIFFWFDAPLAVTTAKPYLWAKVQQKSWNASTQAYVVDSTRYIRLTGEDGYTVEAQYAPNNNPSASQIHTTWQDGDIYMRTKQSNETTWSSWHKIVGESGDETDYTFNISKSLTSTTATTAPENCYYNTWQDAPIAPTSTYPYLWMKIVKKTWNESTQSYDSGTARYARVTGEKGENAFVVDLENEMTNVTLDENGDLIADFDMYFKVRAYYGTTNVLSDSACSVSASCSDSDVTITDTNAKTTGIRVQISSGTHILDTTEVSVTVTHTTYGTRTVIFTLAGVCGGENAVLQELLPSLDAISFARTASGGLTPSSRYLALSIKKTQGGSTSIQSLSESDLIIRWSSTSMPASKTSDNGWGNGTATGISWDNINMQIANTVEATNIYIAAFNSAGTLIDRETIPVIKDGANGTSPYFSDLNNEMDAIQCKHDGSVISDQTVSTVISMWKGSAVEAFVIDNIYRNGTQLTWDVNNNGVWPRVSGSTVSLEFTTSASIADIDDFKITIHSYNDNTVTRELHFTINGVRANAIYRLVPSHSQIVKKKDGTYVPSVNVTCSVKKTENGSTSTPSSSEYTLEKSVNGGSYTTYSATAPSSITSDLKFRLTVGSVVMDLETIPLVSDGNKGDTGDSAPAAFASPAQISIPCYSNGNVKAQKITSVIFSLKVGTNTATVTSCADGTKPTGVTVQGQANNAVTITVGTSATASGLSAGVTFTVTGTYDGKTYSANVTVALIGATQGEQGGTGSRGKIGRFFYYAGAWNDFASTDSFLVNDAQAPYFYYNNNYWVFNPETNGTYTKQDMGTPSSSSANWQIMTSDFKYIITEAIFGSYAHFGSFIVNGDWLISTNGTINGVLYVNGQNFTYNGETKPSYMWFDASNPNNNTGHNFLPNYAVDGRSGDSYQNNGTFTGIVTANLSYSPTGTKTGNDNVTLNPSSDKCGTFLISGITDVKNIYLPLASQYDGLEYNLIQAVYVNDEYKNCNINRSGSEQIYVPTNNKLTAVPMFTLPPNIIVKLKAISGSWYVVQGLT